jgi:hypothetical protein
MMKPPRSIYYLISYPKRGKERSLFEREELVFSHNGFKSSQAASEASEVVRVKWLLHWLAVWQAVPVAQWQWAGEKM